MEGINYHLINPNNLKIIGITGIDLDYNEYIGKTIIGKYLYDNKFNVHLLKISDELGFSYYKFNKHVNYINNNTIERVWNEGLYNILSKIYNGKYSINVLFNYFYALITKPMSLMLSYLGSNNKTIDNKAINNNIYDINNINKTYEEIFINKKNNLYKNELTKYNLLEEQNNKLIWSEMLYLRILNIKRNSYESNKLIFIVNDIQNNNEIKFIKNIGGKIILVETSEKDKLLFNKDDCDININKQLQYENVYNIIDKLYPDNILIKDASTINKMSEIFDINNENYKIKEQEFKINKIDNDIENNIKINNKNEENNSELSSDDDKEYLKVDSTNANININKTEKYTNNLLVNNIISTITKHVNKFNN